MLPATGVNIAARRAFASCARARDWSITAAVVWLTAAAAPGDRIDLLAPAPAAAQIAVDSLMDEDPRFLLAKDQPYFPDGLAPLWISALSRPEPDLRREAADTIYKAHSRGMKGLEAAVEPLSRRLADPAEVRLVRLAAARALIALDARDKADLLFARAEADGLDMALLVEPALARWGRRPAAAIWKSRLGNGQVSSTRRLFAAEGLAAIGEASAAPELRTIVFDRGAAVELRLAAAKAMAQLKAETLEDDANRLAQAPSSPAVAERLLGATLIAQSSGAGAEKLLLFLADDPDPAVAAIAWRRLLDTQPDRLVPLVAKAAGARDAGLRRLAAEAIRLRPDEEGVARLAAMLNDPHPEVRGYARDSLFALAQPPAMLREPVIAGASDALATKSPERWRGREQASLLLAALGHKPAAERLVALLDDSRPEVFITAAWALRRLAAPESFAPMLDHARRLTDAAGVGRAVTQDVDRKLSQLFQAFGAVRYAPSEETMRRYVPKTRLLGDDARGAAIWALGHLHAQKIDAELSAQLADRLSDENPANPETPRVRAMSAVSLGRMGDASKLDVLRSFLRKEGSNGDIGYACAWSIHQLTGESLPVNVGIPKAVSGWFLSPLPPGKGRL